MQIANDTVVRFHYRLSEAGVELESSYEGEPVLYLHGHHNMLTGLEEALNGREEGDAFEVELPPAKAYGARKEGAVERIARKHVKTKGKLKPGMVVQINTAHGPEDALLVKVGLKTVDVDGNHPLAGKTLQFSVEVLEVRAATAEELAHGHAHGVGGHQH